MSIGAVSAPNPVILNGQKPAQTPPPATSNQPTNVSTATAAPAASNVTAVLKEATETAAQTAQEAVHGDHQAQRLIQQHQHHKTDAAAPVSGVVNGNGQITGERINTKA